MLFCHNRNSKIKGLVVWVWGGESQVEAKAATLHLSARRPESGCAGARPHEAARSPGRGRGAP